jgi:hypothetical protein
MSPQSKRDYLERVHIRKRQGCLTGEKTRILDEFRKTIGYHRKHAIWALGNFLRFTQPIPKQRGRSAVLWKGRNAKTLETDLACSEYLFLNGVSFTISFVPQ